MTRRTQGGGAVGRPAYPRGRMSAWRNLREIATQSWRCGYCDRDVASDRGWEAVEWGGSYERHVGFVAICPRCDMPSVISGDGDATIPSARFGEPVEHLPPDVGAMYAEARRAVSSGAPTCAVLACRKILMHVAVDKGADQGKNFLSYVNYLGDEGYVPPDARDWIDEIREHANLANHEIDLMTDPQARDMVEFTAMLLRVIYEYPARGRRLRAVRRGEADD